MIIEESSYLEHHGIKGMKWGQRKAGDSGVSRRVNREAAKDAKEFARAKQFFGEGAGTRRKLIKATVEGKSKHTPGYAKAFQEHLSRQDPSEHASKAVSERKRKDIVNRNKKRAGFLARNFTGEMGTQAAFTAVALSGVAFLSSPKGQQFLSKSVSKLSNLSQSRAGRQMVSDFLKAQGR